jgi:hypothetical protein
MLTGGTHLSAGARAAEAPGSHPPRRRRGGGGQLGGAGLNGPKTVFLFS